MNRRLWVTGADLIEFGVLAFAVGFLAAAVLMLALDFL
jgi:hypothetical protein